MSVDHRPILEKLLRPLNTKPPLSGRPVVYWMQRTQRGWNNPALTFAIGEANARRVPLEVHFVLDASFPQANVRHFVFMLQGLQDVHDALCQRGIPFFLHTGLLEESILRHADHAGLLVCDEHPEPFMRHLRGRIADRLSCPVIAVEADAVIPPRLLADHAHIAARTLRPAVNRILPDFLFLPEETDYHGAGSPMSGDPPDFPRLVEDIRTHPTLEKVPDVSRHFSGGHTEALHRLADFTDTKLDRYHEHHHRADLDSASLLGPYLHFGHIGPAEVALACGEHDGPGAAAFLEQLIVRRELAINCAVFHPGYGTVAMVPEWAVRTLDEHSPGHAAVTVEQMENCETPDPAWNACMLEMKTRGYLHNHIRMYWGKQVLLWSANWREAFLTLLTLNNRYFLDGRDPNGTVGVAWVFGLHDRPFAKRPVFGTVRSMTPGGLTRKFDVHAWISTVHTREK